MLESKFQSKVIKELEKLFPGCIVMKTDPTYIQGLPDLLILYKNMWAALECKRNTGASRRANQEYYVGLMNSMSYSSFISPENKEDVMNDLQKIFKP